MQAKPVLAHRAGMFDQAIEFFQKLFSTNDWPPRWHCGNWSDFHGWFYIISDIGIGSAYVAIPLFLLRLVLKRHDIPFYRIILLFCIFITLCGLTHFMDVMIFWWPAYRLSALLRFLTATISIYTLFELGKVLPAVFTLRTFRELEEEIEKRRIAEVALNQSLDLTVQNNRQLKNFTHILSHNIRNHASNISLLTNILDPESLDEDNTEIFEKLKTVSAGLNKTLEELSEAIKIKETVIQAEDLSFKEMAEKALTIFYSELQSSKAEVDLQLEVDEIKFPKIYLESILTNLISNAIKYRSPERRLKIILKTYRDTNKKLVFECRDNGLGINLDLHGKKIFGLYKTFHDQENAHGVGLFMVKTQVESQNGRIYVDSTEGNGTTFKIVFSEKN